MCFTYFISRYHTVTKLIPEDFVDIGLRSQLQEILSISENGWWSSPKGGNIFSHIFDLLLTDVVMPHMGGVVLVNQLSATRPNLKVLFTSGYTDSALVHQGQLDAGVHLLQKPFSPAALTRKVREVLDT